MTDKELLNIIKKRYVKGNESWQSIADDLNTYPNKLRRLAKKHGINSKSRSEAQKKSLASGRREHPTKGKKRSEEEKDNIAHGVSNFWEDASDKYMENVSERSRRIWNEKSVEERIAMSEKGMRAIREAAKVGSKLEKMLYIYLTECQFDVEYHKERFVGDRKLHIDLFIPTLKVAIEVNGPSHTKDVWGAEALLASQKADAIKKGFLLEHGYVLIRIYDDGKYISRPKAQRIQEELRGILDSIVVSFPKKRNRVFDIKV